MELLLVFRCSFSWLWTWLGLITRSEKAVMSISMSIMFLIRIQSGLMVASRRPRLGSNISQFHADQPSSDAVQGLFDGNANAAPRT